MLAVGIVAGALGAWAGWLARGELGPPHGTEQYTLTEAVPLRSDSRVGVLPAGTTMYFDRGFDEGFGRWVVYVNANERPPTARGPADAIAPLWADLSGDDPPPVCVLAGATR